MNDPYLELEKIKNLVNSNGYAEMSSAKKREIKQNQQRLIEQLVRKKIKEHIEPILIEYDLDKDIRIFNDGEFGVKVNFVDYWSDIETPTSLPEQGSRLESPPSAADKIQDTFEDNEEEEDAIPILEHKLDWSPLNSGFTIENKYHENVFDALGRELQRGESIECSLIVDGKTFKIRFDSPNVPGSRRVRLLYKSKKDNLGIYLQNIFYETFRFLKKEKEIVGARQRVIIPEHMQGLLLLYATDNPLVFRMKYKKLNA